MYFVSELDYIVVVGLVLIIFCQLYFGSIFFLQEEEWCEVGLETLVTLISSEYLRVDSEYQVRNTGL